MQAAATAQVHLPYMEEVFRRYGVPTKLTRLPFVESMFNLKAHSKVGASGIWQFMPKTARYFIYVNNLVDERNAPEKATKAAAQFLANNFQQLGTWPLAVTAYNHGVMGMANAVRKTNTRDIGAIINRYSSPSFRFASRNFYAEFLAAASTYDDLMRRGKIPQPPEVPETSSIILKEPVSVAQLIQHTQLTVDMLRELNPCLLDTAFSHHINKPLPSYYEIKVPRKLVRSVLIALQSFDAKRYARR
jgi:membrane-bound lytic murein transglycosylase D